jgi:hypothetical protein
MRGCKTALAHLGAEGELELFYGNRSVADPYSAAVVSEINREIWMAGEICRRRSCAVVSNFSLASVSISPAFYKSRLRRTSLGEPSRPRRVFCPHEISAISLPAPVARGRGGL